MSQQHTWTQQSYERSLSSFCWQYTEYEAGWDANPALATDTDLQQIVELEQSLGKVPAWAQAVVERSISFPPFCPHYSWPQPYWEILDAIGGESAPGFIHGCYTADYERKERMQSYLLCLDAWLGGVEPDKPAHELKQRGNNAVDWDKACQDLWLVLGERTALKELLVERILHRQRWWVKALAWDDDARDLYCRDQYLGDIDDRGDHNGNPELSDPYFSELEIPRVKRLEAQLAQVCPDWNWFREVIHNSWLCGPKAFRFLERVLWAVGKERPCISLPSHPLPDGDKVPGFLQCDDTYFDVESASAWMQSFVQGLRHWTVRANAARDMEREISRHLGSRTLIKVWLVRLFVRKLELLNPLGALDRV